MQNIQNSGDASLRASEVAEIPLLDILRFLKWAYRTIFIFGALGLMTAIIYLLVTPRQYEVTAQIAMAQIGATNNSAFNLQGVNIEDPNTLIARLSSPTSFNSKEVAACSLGDKQDGATNSLFKAIKISLVKGLPDVVELKAFGGSPESAKNCALAIFEHIKISQSQILTPLLDDAKVRLLDDERRLNKAKELISNVDKSVASMGVAYYLSTRDEMRYLLEEITILKNVLSPNTNRPTRLVAPLATSNTPIAPKKTTLLLLGLLGGLLFGLVITLGVRLQTNLKAQAQRVL